MRSFGKGRWPEILLLDGLVRNVSAKIEPLQVRNVINEANITLEETFGWISKGILLKIL